MILLGTTITIPDPTSIQLPDFQPLWAWIASAIALWYSGVALLMRYTGKGQRVAEAVKTQPTWTTCEGFCPVCSVAKFSKSLAARILISPVEYLVWFPIKYGTLAAVAPFAALTWVAKGPTKTVIGVLDTKETKA